MERPRSRWRALLGRRLRRAVHWMQRRTGYSEDQLRGGLQLTTALFVLMASLSTPAVWRSLTLADSAITPVYAIVTCCVVLQPNLGTAFQFVVMRILGALVGGTLGLLCMYVAWAANGDSYATSATKGAVIVVMLAAFAFIIGLFRFRYQRFWFAFTVGIFSMPMVALNSYWLPYVQYKALFYWWLQIALGVGVAALVSMFVAPITAGQKVRTKTQGCLHGLGELTTMVLEEMLLPKLREDGLLAGIKDVVEGPDAIDPGLRDAVAPMHDISLKVATDVESVRSLLRAVPTEYDVYRTTHVFPLQAYDLLKLNIRAYLSSIMMLLYPLQTGKLSLRAVHAFERELRRAGEFLQEALDQLAGCIEGSVRYKDALHSLRQLEHHWHALGTLCPSPEDGWTDNDLLTVDMCVAVLFNLGTRVRRMYLAMPDAISVEQPNCRAYAVRHFKASAVWDLLPPHRALKRRALERTTSSTPVAAAQALPSPRELLSPRTLQAQASAVRQSQFLRVRSQAMLASAELPHSGSGEGLAAVGEGGAAVAGGAAAAQSQLFLHSSSRKLLAAGSAAELVALGSGGRGGLTPSEGGAAGGAGDDSAGGGCKDGEPQVGAASGQQAGGDAAKGGAGLNGAALPGQLGADLEKGASAFNGDTLFAALALGGSFPPLIPVPDIRYSYWEAALRWVHHTTGFHDQHMSLALQLAVALAAASLLLVMSDSHAALHEKTIWTVVTVCVVFESSVGGVVLKSSMRIVGTALAGLLGIGLLYFTVLCNGGNYENSPAKFIVMSIFLPLVCGFVMMNHMRIPTQFAYSMSVAKFTTPIIALSGYVGTVVAWDTALWRLVNIAVGIGIDLAATLLIFPVTSRRATKHVVQEAVEELASLSESVLLQFVRGPSLAPASPLGTPRPLSRLSTLDTPTPTPPSGPSPPRSAFPSATREQPPGSSGRKGQQRPPAAQQQKEQQKEQQSPQQQGGSADIEMGLLAPGQTGVSPKQAPPALGLSAFQQQGGGHPSMRDLISVYPTPDPEPEAGAGEGLPGSTQQAAAPAAGEGRGRGGGGGGFGGLPPSPEPSSPRLGPVWGGRSGATTTGQSQEPLLSCAMEVAGVGLPPLPRPLAHAASAPPGSVAAPKQPPPTGATARVEGFGTPPRSPAAAAGEAAGTPGMPSPDRRGRLLPPLHIPQHTALPLDGGASTSPLGDSSGPDSPAAISSRLTPSTNNKSPGSAGGGGGGGGFLSGTPKTSKLRAQRSLWLQRHALGRVFVTIHDQSVGVAHLINEMSELALFARYEWDVVSWRPALRPADICVCQRAVRKMLNVLLSFAYVLDAPDIPHLTLLAPFAEEVQTVAAQMRACLEALSHVVGRHLDIHSALAMVSRLALQVQLLLLEVEAGGMPPGANEADVVLGYASLGVLFSAMQTVQLLYRAVVQLLCSPADRAAVEASFAKTAAWGASVEALLTAQGVVLSHLATDAQEEPPLPEASRMAE